MAVWVLPLAWPNPPQHEAQKFLIMLDLLSDSSYSYSQLTEQKATENKEEITRLLEKKFDELFGTDSGGEC